MAKKICVIGGGLAGGILSWNLAAAGHTVTLLERGDIPAPFVPTDEIWNGSDIKAPFTRGTGVGGTSNFWHGGLTILDQTDIEGVQGYFKYPKSPILYSELRSYYDQAISLIRGKQDYSLRDIESQLDSRGIEFAINTEMFKTKALLYPTAPFSTRTLIECAKEQHGLELVTNIEIKRVLFSERTRASIAEGVDLEQGITKKFYADIFILCAGGLGSPKILLESAKLNSRLGKLPVGHFLIDHPTGFVFKAKLRRRMNLMPLFGQPGQGFRIRYGFALRPNWLHSSEYRNHVLFLRPAVSMKDPLTYDILKRKLVSYRGQNLKLVDFAYLLRNTDLLFEAVNFKYGIFHSANYVSGLIFGEQLPNDKHRMYFGENNQFTIGWTVSKEDARSLEKFLNVFFDCHSSMFESFTIFPNVSERLDSAGHHSGGCRMATHPTDGVVNADLRVFGTENLFIVDGSVLGYSGHANTGLTIAALALKCCDAVCNG